MKKEYVKLFDELAFHRSIKKMFVVMLFCSIFYSHVFAGEILLQGVSDDVAVVNGQIVKVGDNVDGVTIVSIESGLVVFRDEQGKVFTRTTQRSGFEKFVDGAKGFFRDLGQRLQTCKTAVKERLEPGDSAGLIGKEEKREAVKANRNVSALSLQQKMDIAESDFSEMKRKIDNVFADFNKTKKNDSDAQKAMNRVQKVIDEDVRRQNDLGLPCPMAAKHDPNMRAYVSWAEGFMNRKKAFMNDVNARMNRL